MALHLSAPPSEASLLSTLSPHPSPFPNSCQRRGLLPLPRRRLGLCRSSKKETSFTDRILDYIEGGPKLRKWYGAPDLLPKDEGLEAEEDASPDEEVRDAVLVTDGDSEIGQMSMAGDVNNKAFLTKAFRGVRAIICPSNDGFFSGISGMKGVQHIVLLSQLAAYRGSSGLQAIISSKARKLAENDEEVVLTSGIPHTIIKSGLLQNTPGGKQGFSFEEGAAAKGKLSKEDAAFICVEALNSIPQRRLVFEVVNGQEKVSDWKEWFAAMIKGTEEL